MPPRALLVALAVSSAALAAGCGGSTTSSTASKPAGRTSAPAKTAHPVNAKPATLHPVGASTLPGPRSGGAATTLNGRIIFSGGLSAAGASTDTVFAVAPGHASGQIGVLPGPAHDAAAATLGNRALLFGGGQSEGSDRIIRVLPGPAEVIGHLPQLLSDLDAVVIGSSAYVLGGYNGNTTSRAIYLAHADGSLTQIGQIPLGVRYPAAATDGVHLIIAGGETASGSPTADAWSFDPATRTITRLPGLPAPTDHAPGAWLDGRFYVLGGLREGAFTSTILSWAPGERRWRSGGRLPQAISDSTAATLDGQIAVLGGRSASGATAAVTYLAAS